ncbi:hypothetical protein [Bradyrhizobium erythrophlei]|uniref:hypothetical protein n=1 Tax=Bradyrhizobium erythrophlei TaxID=1437360 RepID=UPI00156042AB|nr:hypothetical protein [Bradyrhizobium erythrophlei]
MKRFSAQGGRGHGLEPFFVNILTLSLVFLFPGWGFRKRMESSIDVENYFSRRVFVALFRSGRSPPSPLSSSARSLRGVIRR